MRACAVGIFSALINSLAKIFEASNCAAFLFGPKTFSPSASNKSTIPAASWSSGPTTVRSIRFSLAKRASFGKSFGGIKTFSPISCVPAFPGAQKIRSAPGDCASFHARACSRPPLPTTRIFTGASVRQLGAKNKFARSFEKDFVCPLAAPQSVALPVRPSPTHIGRARLRRAVTDPALQSKSARSQRRHLRRRNIDRYLFGASKDRQLAGRTDPVADKFLVQIVHVRDRFVVEGDNHVIGPYAGLFRWTPFFNRDHHCTTLLRQLIKARHSAMQWRSLPSHADVTATDPPLLDQPAGNEFGGVARDRETNSLGRSNHRWVDSDHFARGIRQRTTGVSRIQRGVGLNDVVDQSA